jgi:hypothetical protein
MGGIDGARVPSFRAAWLVNTARWRRFTTL